jgi:hypothetical protein
MELASVRELKTLLDETVLAPLSASGGVIRKIGLPAAPLEQAAGPVPTLALGIVPTGPGDFRLAVRLQRRELEGGRELELIRRKAKGELDVRYVGQLSKAADPPWTQRRHRPLKLGTSIGHFEITAGGRMGPRCCSRTIMSSPTRTKENWGILSSSPELSTAGKCRRTWSPLSTGW